MCKLSRFISSVFGSNQTPPVVVGPVIKKALIVGTDIYKMPGSNLNGCVSDAEDMYDLLVNTYKFLPDNVRVLTNDRATKANVVDRLNWLVTGEGPMECVYYNSSHGTQIRQRIGDELEPDGLDEVIVTYDFDWNDPATQLVDKDIHKILVKLNALSRLAMIVDSCHSGSMDRELGKTPRFIVPPFCIRARSMNRKLKLRRIGERATHELENHILLSGCKDEQTSAETRFGDKTRGALTFNLTKRLRASPEACWTLVHKDVCRELKSQRFEQDPQLSGSIEIQGRLPFGGKS